VAQALDPHGTIKGRHFFRGSEGWLHFTGDTLEVVPGFSEFCDTRK
jgi:hypothetical protein